MVNVLTAQDKVYYSLLTLGLQPTINPPNHSLCIEIFPGDITVVVGFEISHGVDSICASQSLA